MKKLYLILLLVAGNAHTCEDSLPNVPGGVGWKNFSNEPLFCILYNDWFLIMLQKNSHDSFILTNLTLRRFLKFNDKWHLDTDFGQFGTSEVLLDGEVIDFEISIKGYNTIVTNIKTGEFATYDSFGKLLK